MSAELQQVELTARELYRTVSTLLACSAATQQRPAKQKLETRLCSRARSAWCSKYQRQANRRRIQANTRQTGRGLFLQLLQQRPNNG